ncbi:MAG: methionine--tRNA ligase [Sedimentisphaeraceae bacterium JB056]
MSRNIVVTSALPYANGPIHIGHLVEYIQTDIWVRYQKLAGNNCLYFCADDTHGTPIMLSARNKGITPEDMIGHVHKEHYSDFTDFQINFENYYTTHSPENKELSALIYNKLKDKGSIDTKEIEHAYCDDCKMFLPDRFIRGACPVCGAEDQYGDSCDKCGATYSPNDLKDTKCSLCGQKPVQKKTVHYFFKLADYEQDLRELLKDGHTHSSVANKLDEWFDAGLKDWDISRDGPYFGFNIPGEDDKYFYVWLDAPVGYMASVKNYCDSNGMDFNEVWNGKDWELYHFIGKDIMYFHALFWPAMLIGSGFKTADKLFVHGFLTVDGHKMSKSKGTFIKARSYLNHLDPQYLRYYYAAKLADGVDDIDLNLTDFVNRVNSDLVGKLANLASRSVPMLRKKLDGKIGQMDSDGIKLVNAIREAKDDIIADYEGLRYSSVIRRIATFSDKVNKYVDEKQPWVTVKTDAEATRATLSAILNAVKLLTIYIKPVLPVMAEKIEGILGTGCLSFADTDSDIAEGHIVNDFERLIERVEMEKIEAMIEEEKAAAAPVAEEETYTLDEPLAEECDFDDFMKVDLRVAKVVEANPVEGANKLLQLTLDIGGIKKNVFAGISKAYKPEELVGRLVVCVANLKPRKMRFGLSEGMVIASGPGGKDVFLLSPDSGAQPGQRVH